MPDLQQLFIAYVLPVLIYGAITGLLNLLLANKSRIDSWAEANPRRAAVLKVLRGVGFDPWHVVAAASLWVSKRLPAAQRAGSVEDLPAPKPRKPPVLPMLYLLALALLCVAQPGIAGCGPGAAKPACTPEAHARELELFTARVNVVCVAYDEPEACPYYAELQADFDHRIDAGCGQ